MAAATDCDQPVPINCSPLEKYNYIKTINDAVVTVPTCPTKYFPFVLQMHQLMIGKYMEHYETDSILAWHGLGSGKTITSIMAALQPGHTVYVFCPAALIDNYKTELENYADILLEIKSYSHPANAIEVANKFIEKANTFKPQLDESETFPLVNELMRQVGTGKRAKAPLITKIDTATDYATLMTILTTPGGTRKKGGMPSKQKQSMTYGTITFKFISSNGDLTKPEANVNFREFINDPIPNSMGVMTKPPANIIGVIDESQILISAALGKLKYSKVEYHDVQRELRTRRGIITQAEFEEFDCCSALKGRGYAKTSQDIIYEGLCQSTSIGNPNRAQLILLSGTPISHFPAEIALIVNILSGDSKKMCYNKNVFNFNFGPSVPLPIYNYGKSDAERQADISTLQRLRLNNHDEFVELCKPYISYFGNMASMMPTINAVATKHVYDNNNNVCANILECRMTTEQLGWLKYLEYIESEQRDSRELTGYIKKRFYDYTFELSTPRVAVADVPRSNMSDEVTFTGRPFLQDAFLEEYTRDFQDNLMDPTEEVVDAARQTASMGALFQQLKTKTPRIGGKMRKMRKTRKMRMKGGVGRPNYVINAKLSVLRDNIRQDIGKRHVIYSNSRISNVMISRMLTELGFTEIKNTHGLGDDRPRYAFLTGESVDKKDEDPMFKFQLNEGLAEDKQLLIRAYNNPEVTNLKILIIGNAVAEGITLKRTDFMHIYSFPYNISKMLQILARANRNCVFPEDQHGQRGLITPFLYLSTIEPDDGAITAFGSTIRTDNAGWLTYNATRNITTSEDERTFFEIAVKENDKFIPHLFAIKNAAFDK
jgi:hypothetical protein